MRANHFMRRAGRQWSYTVVMLAVYIATFVFWKAYPSRVGFVFGGGCAVAVLLAGMWWARSRGYFCNRLDLSLHLYVILDLCFESLAYEGLRSTVDLRHLISGYVPQFHDNNNYFFCGATFAVLVGGYRWIALRNLALAQQAKLPLDRLVVDDKRELSAD